MLKPPYMLIVRKARLRSERYPALVSSSINQYGRHMRSVAHQLRSWRTPVILAGAVLTVLIAVGEIDRTAARAAAAVMLCAVLAGLLSSRKP